MVLLAGYFFSGGFAAEPAAPDAFEKVRQEIEAAKATRDTPAQPSAGLSSSALPEWQGTAPPLPASVSPGKISDPRQKSSNWLVEAMSRPTAPDDASNARSTTTRSGEFPPRLGETRSPERIRIERTAAVPDFRELKAFANQPVAPDPFARFLGDWMTPQDYALLRPATATESAPRDGGRETGMAAPLRAGLAQDLSISIRMTGTGEPTKRIPAPTLARENPYLSANTAPTAVPTPQLVTLKPAPVSGARPAASANSLEAAPNSAAAPKTPDFTKPTDDEKYFKQLKRF